LPVSIDLVQKNPTATAGALINKLGESLENNYSLNEDAKLAINSVKKNASQGKPITNDMIMEIKRNQVQEQNLSLIEQILKILTITI